MYLYSFIYVEQFGQLSHLSQSLADSSWVSFVVHQLKRGTKRRRFAVFLLFVFFLCEVSKKKLPGHDRDDASCIKLKTVLGMLD